MTQNQSTNGTNKGNWFSFLYRTRVKVFKGSTNILNLSLLFSLIALLTAPWLVFIGAVAALVLGYRFSLERNAEGFSDSFHNVVQDAASTVKSAVDSFTQESGQPQKAAEDNEYTQQ